MKKLIIEELLLLDGLLLNEWTIHWNSENTDDWVIRLSHTFSHWWKKMPDILIYVNDNDFMINTTNDMFEQIFPFPELEEVNIVLVQKIHNTAENLKRVYRW